VIKIKLEYAPCEALCEICKDFKKWRRNGCVETKGKPWFLKRFTKFEVCPIYEYIISKKISRCIDCKKFPCKVFLEWYNPRIGFFRSS